ncbi:MAG: ABC transporter permease [Hyphomonadaceae bacterium]
MIGLVILATARLFVPFEIQHPVWAVLFLVLIAVSFCLFGFILGLLADGFERLQIVPMLILTPLTFLGGTFYSLDMLPPLWQKITLFNPIVYLISGFRWAFYGEDAADVHIGISVAATSVFLVVCFAIVYTIFRTGYKLKT